jgi:hypothetical protein
MTSHGKSQLKSQSRSDSHDRKMRWSRGAVGCHDNIFWWSRLADRLVCALRSSPLAAAGCAHQSVSHSCTTRKCGHDSCSPPCTTAFSVMTPAHICSCLWSYPTRCNQRPFAVRMDDMVAAHLSGGAHDRDGDADHL